jgi:uncharacterized repeat protein (TIGR01451 family)
MLKSSQLRQKHLVSAIAVVLGGMGLVSAAHAAAPAAGVNISNIASATYTDASGKPQSVNSNEVKTTVLQVASFTLVADRSTTSNPNGQVSLSHTLTNTGNNTDSFTIAIANVNTGDDFNFAAPKVYLDANNDGTADNTTDLNGTTITLPAGGVAGLIVVATTPTTAVNDTTGQLTISATSVFDATVVAANTDTVTVTGDAVVEVKKTASVSSVLAGGEIEYVLTYKNTGNSTATDVNITDVLPSNVVYVTGSATVGGTAQTDAVDADGFVYDAASGTVTFKVPSLAINTTGSVKFRVMVKTTAAAGNVANTATFVYDPDNAGIKTPAPAQPTNTTNTTIAATYTGVINDSSTLNTATGDDDKVLVTINQGQTAVFDTYVWNNSNAPEAFKLSSDALAALPVGSTVTYFKADGVTPLSGATTDAIAAGSSVKVVVKVTLPSTYAGSAGLDNLTTVVTSTAVDNAASVDTVSLVISDILVAGVDLTNGGNTPADGFGPYDPATVVDTATVEAGQPYSFPIAVTNTGPTSDTFNLSSSVPAGWTVVFYEADDVTGVCSGTVAATNLVVAAGMTNKLCAVVTPPSTATPTTADVVFSVTSTNSGSTDSLKDTLTVDENRSITFNPDNNGQVAPGGTVVYTHTITNTGNVTEGDAAGELLLNLNTPTNGFTTTVYVDLNKDGIAQPTELLTGNDLATLLAGSAGGAGLQAGESINILVKVEAPANAPIGQQEITTVTLVPTGAINGEAAPVVGAKTDSTTVTDGQVRLDKTQALDAACDGTADGAFSNNVISAKPGACVVYRIVATNEGNAAVTNVVVNDSAPTFTTLQTIPAASNDGTTGTVSVTATTATNTVGTMAPAATANLLFSVKIAQ